MNGSAYGGGLELGETPVSFDTRFVTAEAAPAGLIVGVPPLDAGTSRSAVWFWAHAITPTTKTMAAIRAVTTHNDLGTLPPDTEAGWGDQFAAGGGGGNLWKFWSRGTGREGTLAAWTSDDVGPRARWAPH